MKYRKLGSSDLNVSRICLGTMTWGVQNTQSDADAQIDMALDAGVNFIDTAELYPVPPKGEYAGATEEIIGDWLSRSGRRDDVIIASKMAGIGRFWRGGAGLVPSDVAEAVDGSLKRMKTDVIDLYQLHWPQRQTNLFAQRDFQPDLHTSDSGEDIIGMLEALQVQIKVGKIRYIGVSNETPWGIMKYLAAAETGLPKIISSQNPYSLLQRNWDVSTAEVAIKEGVDLLAYSPLAGGVLSGKYMKGAMPEGARFALPWGANLMGRHAANKDSTHVEFYANLAAENDMTPTQLAIAFVNSRGYLGSNIIGATTTEQLAEILSAEDITLSPEILNQIEDYHDAHPSPSLGRGGPRDAG